MGNGIRSSILERVEKGKEQVKNAEEILEISRKAGFDLSAQEVELEGMKKRLREIELAATEE